jgi:hypothetical protein
MGISRQPSPVQVMIDQKQLQNMEYFKCLGRMITNDARCTCEMKTRISMAKKKKHSTRRRLFSPAN